MPSMNWSLGDTGLRGCQPLRPSGKLALLSITKPRLTTADDPKASLLQQLPVLLSLLCTLPSFNASFQGAREFSRPPLVEGTRGGHLDGRSKNPPSSLLARREAELSVHRVHQQSASIDALKPTRTWSFNFPANSGSLQEAQIHHFHHLRDRRRDRMRFFLSPPPLSQSTAHILTELAKI